jgi:DNA topoisomerase IB
VRDRLIAKIINACQELPGEELIRHVDEEGNCRDVASTDVNDYLREITGKDIAAKDFRTWAGTVLAAMALDELESFDSSAQAKRIFELLSKRSLRGWATQLRSAANATSIQRCRTPRGRQSGP